MPDTVMKVEHLSKRYRIGQYVGGAYQYRALRDVLTDAMYAPFRRLRARSKRQAVGSNPTAMSHQPSANFIWALKDVSFEVKQGEVVGIIGRNGAGKSTLLKLLSRITEPTEGRAQIKDRLGSLLEVGTGFHPELTGRENIYLSGAILGMTKKEIDRKFDEIVDFSGIEKFIDTPVKRYSSGMWVRLGFAVAAHLEPEILLVDEVLAVGDAAFQKKCLGKMGNVAKEGRTVLFVSHNMQAIQNLCSRTIWLADGQIEGDGLASQIVMDYLETISRAETTEQIGTLIKQLPPDSYFRLIDVRFTQNGFPLTRALSGEPIEVKIDYEVKKITSNFRLYLDILDNLGTLLIKSFHDCDSPEATVAEPGEYISKVIIPGDFLAPKKYMLRIGATVFGDRELTGPGLSFSLKVYKSGRVNRGYTLNVEVGKLAPLLTWETKTMPRTAFTSSVNVPYSGKRICKRIGEQPK